MTAAGRAVREPSVMASFGVVRPFAAAICSAWKSRFAQRFSLDANSEVRSALSECRVSSILRAGWAAAAVVATGFARKPGGKDVSRDPPVRQILSTLLLLVLTVFPTAWVAMTAWRINQPGHVRDVEVELGRNLGFQVSLGASAIPAREVVYRGMVLRGQEPRGKGFAEIVRRRFGPLERGDHELIALA